MNRYETTFFRSCPHGGELIEYRLQVESIDKILVETINAAIAKIPDPTHQEDAVDVLCDEIPGAAFTVIGTHQGVTITCLR